jgi:hypothetical protein
MNILEQEFIRSLMDDEIVEEILWNFIPFDFEDLLVQYKAKHYAKYGEEFQY